MNRFIFILLLTSFAIVHFTMADDINWRDDAAELKKIRHDNFELRALPAENAKDFTFAFGDPAADHATIAFQNSQMVLHVSDGTTETVNNAALDGKSPLIIRRHGVWLEVLTPAK